MAAVIREESSAKTAFADNTQPDRTDAGHNTEGDKVDYLGRSALAEPTPSVVHPQSISNANILAQYPASTAADPLVRPLADMVLADAIPTSCIPCNIHPHDGFVRYTTMGPPEQVYMAQVTHSSDYNQVTNLFGSEWHSLKRVPINSDDAAAHDYNKSVPFFKWHDLPGDNDELGPPPEEGSCPASHQRWLVPEEIHINVIPIRRQVTETFRYALTAYLGRQDAEKLDHVEHSLPLVYLYDYESHFSRETLYEKGSSFPFVHLNGRTYLQMLWPWATDFSSLNVPVNGFDITWDSAGPPVPPWVMTINFTVSSTVDEVCAIFRTLSPSIFLLDVWEKACYSMSDFAALVPTRLHKWTVTVGLLCNGQPANHDQAVSIQRNLPGYLTTSEGLKFPIYYSNRLEFCTRCELVGTVSDEGFHRHYRCPKLRCPCGINYDHLPYECPTKGKPALKGKRSKGKRSKGKESKGKLPVWKKPASPWPSYMLADPWPPRRNMLEARQSHQAGEEYSNTINNKGFMIPDSYVYSTDQEDEEYSADRYT